MESYLSQNQNKQSVHREMNFEYQQFLWKFYGVDKESLKSWMNQNFSQFFFRQLDEICVDKDQAVVKDITQKELIEEATCSICLGIVRLPGKMCNSCSKIFCQLCVGKISGMPYNNSGQDHHNPNFHMGQNIPANPGQLSFQVMQNQNQFGNGHHIPNENQPPRQNQLNITCPCCKVKTDWSQLNFPKFMKNQIENFEFKCKKKNCLEKKQGIQESKEYSINNNMIPMMGEFGVAAGSQQKKTYLLFKYHDYIEHLRYNCQIMSKQCPHGCREYLDKNSIEDHFIYHECSNLRGICSKCNQRVVIDQFREHPCHFQSYCEFLKEQVFKHKLQEQEQQRYQQSGSPMRRVGSTEQRQTNSLLGGNHMMIDQQNQEADDQNARGRFRIQQMNQYSNSSSN